MTRPFTVIDVEQRTPAWFAARLGRLTGSRAGDMLAMIKSGESAARRDYRLQLVVERLTGVLQEDPYINGAMQRGIDCEPLAFAAYEAHTGIAARRAGFLQHVEHMAGCSLDGYVGDFEGIIEIKSPKSATHLMNLRATDLPAVYRPQVLHNLWVSGAEWCDFVSFDDRFPDSLQLKVITVPRVEADIAAYAKLALAFLAEVENEYQAVRTMADPAAVLRQAAGVV